MKEIQKPTCLALIICDLVHRDSLTGKHTLIGTFGHLAVKSVPAEAEFSVYVCVTDALGDVPLSLRIMQTDSTGETLLTQMTGQLHAENPLAIVELAIRTKVRFPKAGLYHLELFSGDEVLATRRMKVTAARGKPRSGPRRSSGGSNDD